MEKNLGSIIVGTLLVSEEDKFPKCLSKGQEMNLGCSFFNEKKGKDVVDEEGIFRGLLEQILFLGVDLARIRVI